MIGIHELPTEQHLIAAALALGAESVSVWSELEARLCKSLPRISETLAGELRRAIADGGDPLGAAFCALRPPEIRRKMGATYTPKPIVDSMIEWAAQTRVPQRIVDPGSGSARFLIAAGRRFHDARLIGIELDPVAALIGRGCLAAAGLAARSEVRLADYREFTLEPSSGPTLFLGNPPYVRHHGIAKTWKTWLVAEARRLGVSASQLAGLHTHFFLATALQGRPRDFGVFITSAEWLDVNYGALVRDLLARRLGGRNVVVIEPAATPFPDAATTAAVSTFDIGARQTSIQFQRVDSIQDLGDLRGGRRVRRERAEQESRWSLFTRRTKKPPSGFIELGEVFRVHRGQVTGANAFWIAGSHSEGLPPAVLFKAVTRAREVIEAQGVLRDASNLRAVIDIPVDLDVLPRSERRAVEEFLVKAKAAGADRGYIAGNRRAWWSVGLRGPAAIVSTYMVRRPPAFALNEVRARHLNIAHGLYPLQPLDAETLRRLVDYLQRSVRVEQGRTYAGGLTKFEPREMERIPIPADFARATADA
jgi:hypothetical protein